MYASTWGIYLKLQVILDDYYLWFRGLYHHQRYTQCILHTTKKNSFHSQCALSEIVSARVSEATDLRKPGPGAGGLHAPHFYKSNLPSPLSWELCSNSLHPHNCPFKLPESCACRYQQVRQVKMDAWRNSLEVTSSPLLSVCSQLLSRCWHAHCSFCISTHQNLEPFF